MYEIALRIGKLLESMVEKKVKTEHLPQNAEIFHKWSLCHQNLKMSEEARSSAATEVLQAMRTKSRKSRHRFDRFVFNLNSNKAVKMIRLMFPVVVRQKGTAFHHCSRSSNRLHQANGQRCNRLSALVTKMVERTRLPPNGSL